ncbi:hypothetical protein Bca52824_092323 [Brassica carinata]|uniref:Uncharacterized protein n=1 Tax=Brassica carinata TaxID=52824 RepID=A0A8X7NU59_BRACI|nr:hypothetical protein Bca52824_092323 [Brassica carinata]
MSTSKKWNDAMIGRYYSVLGRVPDKDNIKEIAKCLKARSEILNNIGKKKKKKNFSQLTSPEISSLSLFSLVFLRFFALPSRRLAAILEVPTDLGFRIRSAGAVQEKKMTALSSTSCLHSLAGQERYFLSCKTSEFSKPLFINPSLKKPIFSVLFCLKQSDREERQIQQESRRVEEEEYWIVTALRSKYNEIVIVDTVDARYLLLDSTKNAHSVINKGGQNWTGSYWVYGI